MTKRLLIHVPKGGQGKSTVTANLSLMLAERGKRVLVIDGCESRGLEDYFNVEADYGIHELLSGVPLSDLAGEIRTNCDFLPAGDLLSANDLLNENKVFPSGQLAKMLRKVEKEYDFVLFDTDPEENSHLFFNILYYIDFIISPVETKRAGFKKLCDWKDTLEVLNSQYEDMNKETLQIDVVIPYWYDARIGKDKERLHDIEEAFGEVVTEPIRQTVGLRKSREEGLSLGEYLGGKKPQNNEAQALSVFEAIIEKFITE
jgi:chromosome partitioning protein